MAGDHPCWIKSTQRAQTSADAKITTDSDPGFESGFSQNVADSSSCRRQSFRQVWYKSAVDCMRNVNKCPKIPYSSTVKKMKG